MRGKLVAHDVIECVLGLGPNLFYNSPMEACVVICRMNKPKERRNKVLFINAVNEVTRERAQSSLTDDHIQRIVAAHQAFGDEDGFARVVSNDEIREKVSNLSIPLYVRTNNSNGQESRETVSLKQTIIDWQKSSKALRESMDSLFGILEGISSKTTAPSNAATKATSHKEKVVQPAFKRAVLAAEITSKLHMEPTFGSVKHEKIVFLCEKMLGLSEALEHHHLRQAAGPYDPKARRSTDMTFTKNKWFIITKNGKRIEYRKGEKYGGHEGYFEQYFPSERKHIHDIVELLRTATTEQCEILATLFSAWHDFLDQGITPTDDQIVQEVLCNWHESKKRIPVDRWHNALVWMRDKQLTPTDAHEQGVAR
jgi:type I restriction enzyme M protein